MVELCMAGLLVGSVLGLRYRVLVLVPVELAACMAAMLVACSGAQTWAAASLGLVCFCVATQVSYALAIALPARLSPRTA